jgi:DNA repair photolyase
VSDQIGITERGDPAIDCQWTQWVVDGNPAILITKDPLKLFDHIKVIIEDGKCEEVYPRFPNIIVHTTITGFARSIIEPNVPDVDCALLGFEELCKLLGPERIVLRIDPIVPTDAGIDTAYNVLCQAQKLFKTRVRVSFIDQYDHVKKRFKDIDVELPWTTFHAPLKLRKKAWERLGRPEVCGEPDFECTGCISAKDCELLGVQLIDKFSKQRLCCACLGNKKELLSSRSRCFHKCVYCYYGKYDL